MKKEENKVVSLLLHLLLLLVPDIDAQVRPLIRVVSQTFLVEGHDVSCFGSCDHKNLFVLKKCEGPVVSLKCSKGFDVIVHSALLGVLHPELNVCDEKRRKFECKGRNLRRVPLIIRRHALDKLNKT